jgi:hypothetical protein
MKRSQKRITDAIDRLEAILASLPFDVWMKDMQGGYVYISKRNASGAETGI